MGEDLAPDIEMVVDSVRVHMGTGRYVLFLREVVGDRVLPVWIGQWEAQAIAMRLQGIAAERPLTHDLMLATLTAIGARLERVVISSLSEDTFYARLVLATADGRQEVDARPSDAIALAVRVDCRIFAAARVLDQAKALPKSEDEDEDEADPASGLPGRGTRTGRVPDPQEFTGEPLDPRRLHIFREFVNSLDSEGDQRGS